MPEDSAEETPGDTEDEYDNIIHAVKWSNNNEPASLGRPEAEKVNEPPNTNSFELEDHAMASGSTP